MTKTKSTDKMPDIAKAAIDASNAIKEVITDADGRSDPVAFTFVLSLLIEGFLKAIRDAGYPEERMPMLANKLSYAVMAGMEIPIDEIQDAMDVMDADDAGAIH